MLSRFSIAFGALAPHTQVGMCHSPGAMGDRKSLKKKQPCFWLSFFSFFVCLLARSLSVCHLLGRHRVTLGSGGAGHARKLLAV